MNSTEIFSLALGFNEPWEITEVEISADSDSVKQLDIYLVLNAEQNSKMRQAFSVRFMIPRSEAGDI